MGDWRVLRLAAFLRLSAFIVVVALCLSTVVRAGNQQTTTEPGDTMLSITDNSRLAEKSKPIPFKSTNTDMGNSMLKVATALLSLVVVATALLWFMRKRLTAVGSLPAQLGKRIVIQDRKHLHRDQFVHLLEVDGETFLAVTGSQHCTLLKTKDQREDISE